MSDDDNARANIERWPRSALPDDAVILPSTERLRELKARACKDDLPDAERDAAVAEWRAAAVERERRAQP